MLAAHALRVWSLLLSLNRQQGRYIVARMHDLTAANGFGGPLMPIQDGPYSVVFPQFTSLHLLFGFFCGVHLKPLRFAFLVTAAALPLAYLFFKRAEATMADLI